MKAALEIILFVAITLGPLAALWGHLGCRKPPPADPPPPEDDDN